VAFNPQIFDEPGEFHAMIEGPNGTMVRKYDHMSHYLGYLVCRCPKCGAFVLTNTTDCSGGVGLCSTHSGADSQIVIALSPRG